MGITSDIGEEAIEAANEILFEVHTFKRNIERRKLDENGDQIYERKSNGRLMGLYEYVPFNDYVRQFEAALGWCYPCDNNTIAGLCSCCSDLSEFNGDWVAAVKHACRQWRREHRYCEYDGTYDYIGEE